MSERPKRSTRATAKVIEAADERPVASTSKGKKRKADGVELGDEQLDFMLKNPKSALTTMDIADLINAQTWDMLSPEHQERLAKLMPTTAFITFQPTAEPHHPSRTIYGGESMVEEQYIERSVDLVDPALFNEPHFLAASRTFQDHLFSDWMSDSAMSKLQKYEEKIRAGTSHAPWKDEVWEQEHAAERAAATTEMNNLAGDAAELKLTDLVKNGILLVGDIIAYKRNFTTAGFVIEKDVLIDSVDPRTYAVTVLLPRGSTKDLPRHRVLRKPEEPPVPDGVQSMEIHSPTQLETGILDVDGQVEKTKRPRGNAWKSSVVWRLRAEIGMGMSHRGERDAVGTLFYLRQSYYHDS